MNTDGRAFYGESKEKESEGNKYGALAYCRGRKTDGWIKKRMGKRRRARRGEVNRTKKSKDKTEERKEKREEEKEKRKKCGKSDFRLCLRKTIEEEGYYGKWLKKAERRGGEARWPGESRGQTA